jgi:hypothetical protein
LEPQGAFEDWNIHLNKAINSKKDDNIDEKNLIIDITLNSSNSNDI